MKKYGVKRCPFCSSEWEPRVENPVRCPRCMRVLPESIGVKGESVGDSGGDKTCRHGFRTCVQCGFKDGRKTEK